MGELRPGDKLDLDLLAKEYGVSRTPIREACLSLAHDKLVKMAPRSGVSIIGVSVVDLKDNFALMAMLAGRAASWAALRATPDDLAEVKACRDEVKAAVSDGRSPSAANYDFHRRINRASRSPRLAVLIAQTAGLFPATSSSRSPSKSPAVCPITTRSWTRWSGVMPRRLKHSPRRTSSRLRNSWTNTSSGEADQPAVVSNGPSLSDNGSAGGPGAASA